MLNLRRSNIVSVLQSQINMRLRKGLPTKSVGDSRDSTWMTKSTRPVEFIAFSLSASWRAVLRPDVLCLKTEYKVSSDIKPNPGVAGSCGDG